MKYLGLLSHPLSSLDNPLIPGLEIRFRLAKAPDRQVLFCGPTANATEAEAEAWVLPSSTEYVLVVQHCSLFIKRITLSDSLFNSHVKMLKTQVARYYYYS